MVALRGEDQHVVGAGQLGERVAAWQAAEGGKGGGKVWEKLLGCMSHGGGR